MTTLRKPPGAVLGIDYGTKRVGLAVSDPLRIIAAGAGTVPNDDRLTGAVASLVRQRSAVLVVVGVPYAPDGGEGEKAREVLAFMDRLRAELGVPVEPWDESRTTVDAHRALREAGMRRKHRRQKGRVDEMAARLMLQGFLDSLSTVATA
jgi:putative Holliday junction resolvase